jgi:putative transposase
MPSNLQFEDIQEVRILPGNQYFCADLLDKKEFAINHYLNPGNALAIDPGIKSWLSCVSNPGTSFIFDGRKVKSLNQC